MTFLSNSYCCSERECQRGDEIAWYADGGKLVRNEYNPVTSYAFGIVFFVLFTVKQRKLKWIQHCRALYIVVLVKFRDFCLLFNVTDRVFGSSATTQEVYDVAARPVVKAAMEGVNGAAN